MKLTLPTLAYEIPTVQMEQQEQMDTPIVWWVVLVIVLLALAAVLTVAAAIWCVANGHGVFIGLRPKDGWSLYIGCSN